MKKRLLSTLLALCMVLSLLPATAWAEESEQPGAPTDLRWGSPEYAGLEYPPDYCIPGTINWTTGESDQGQAQIWIYRRDNDGSETQVGGTMVNYASPNGNTSNQRQSHFVFIKNVDDYGAGTYYFTVQSVSNNTMVGKPVQSDEWKYTAPENVIPKFSVLGWTVDNGRLIAKWENPGKFPLYGYDMEVQFSSSDDTISRLFSGTTRTVGNGDITSRDVSDWVREAKEGNSDGSCYFSYRIRALSGDLTSYQNSPWSEWSEGYDITQLGESEEPEMPKEPEPLPKVAVSSWTEENGKLTANWNSIGENYSAGSYQYEVKFASAENEAADKAPLPNSGSPYTDTKAELPGGTIADLAPGYYFYRVRAVSTDTKYEDGEWSDWSESYEVKAKESEQPGTKLGAPANLAWGKNYSFKDASDKDEIPGMVSWETAEPDENTVRIKIYRDGDMNNPIGDAIWEYGPDQNNSAPSGEYVSGNTTWKIGQDGQKHGYRSAWALIQIQDRLIVGANYYFSVQSIDESHPDRNSEEILSPNAFHYEPSGQLSPVTIANDWETVTMPVGPNQVEHKMLVAKWTPLSNPSQVYMYEVEYAASDEEEIKEGTSYQRGGGSSVMGRENQAFIDMDAEGGPGRDLRNTGCRYCFYRVRAISADITKYRASDWSEWSKPYQMKDSGTGPAPGPGTSPGPGTDPTPGPGTNPGPGTDPTPDPGTNPEPEDPVVEEIKDALDAITSEDSEEILTQVQEIGAEDLYSAMLADQDAENEGSVIERLAKLETEVGGQAEVEDEKGIFAELGNISIVGANLNKQSADDGAISLVVDEVKQEHVIPERYDSASAVKFSMNLQKANGDPCYAEGEKLAVPVQVKLPVPASIDPQLLIILHYSRNGSVETIDPHIRQEGGKWFASFVLNHFSDFAMVQRSSSDDPDTPDTPADPDTPTAPSTPNTPSGNGSVGSGDSSGSDPAYNVTIPSRITGGTVKVTPTSASEGQRVTLTVKANSGYELAKLTVTDSKDTALTLTNQGNGKYTFTMPKGNVSVDAQFQRIESSVTPVQTVSVNPTNDKLEVNGKPQTPVAYKINDYNYFKLRDIAALLNGTGKQFSVGYESSTGEVSLTSGQPYAVTTSDLTTLPAESRQATISTNVIYINGVRTQLTIYKIDGYNYFKLRDLASALDFSVGWTAERGMFLESDKPYSE